MAGSLTQHDLGRSVERLVRKGLGALVILGKSRRRTPQAILLRGGDAQVEAGEQGLGEEAFAGANAFVFGSEIFDAARAAIEAQRNPQADVTEVLEVLAEKPGHVQAVLPTGWSLSVESMEDLLEINRLVLDALSPAEVPGERSGNRIMGPVVVDETATIESSVLNGPLAIAAHAHITDSYVGPYTAIGARARIDGAEIERSVVFPAASIKSVGSRIEGSVIGVNARVTREFVPPRATAALGRPGCTRVARLTLAERGSHDMPPWPSIERQMEGQMARAGIEPATPRFSVRLSRSEGGCGRWPKRKKVLQAGMVRD